jgi:basic membrane lipoprotein Med (substrate-binding protein (PBP1-ABC) superfamily)
VITSVVYDWYKPLKGAIKAIAEGNFKSYRAQNYFRGLNFKEGSLYLGKWGQKVPEKVKKAVQEMHSKIVNGSVEIKKVDTKLD